MGNRYVKLCAVLALMLSCGSPAAGFDTLWHAEATQKVGEQYGFSNDAIGIMELGNFSPDLFGPIQDYAAEHLVPEERKALQIFGTNNAEARAAALFLHFDNLDGKLDRNSQFDYIFINLLRDTRQTLAEYENKRDVDESTRKTLILVTLGASLHTVQDFYSHSDWIHNNFDNTPVKMVRAGRGSLRAPTWFEVRDRLGNPDGWPVLVNSGIYPPVAGKRNTHTHMNHDNSRLIYRELETAGQPLLSQAQYHGAGPVPVRPGDQSSVFQHQQLAVNTAIAASNEWVLLVEQNSAAKSAINDARTWELRDPRLKQELQAGLALEVSLSCAAGRWDGENPPAERGMICKAINEGMSVFLPDTNLFAGGSVPEWQSEIAGLAGGIGATLLFPSALQYGGQFWDIHGRYHVLDRLTNGFGSDGGDYRFGQD